jgi:hypothetical protein
MDLDTCGLIEAIHQTPAKLVLAVTGGGTGVAAQLLSIPGGSRTVLEVLVPYHDQALIDFLGQRPERFCSAATSRLMAARARARAQWLAPGELILGIGCTASLASDRPKRGDHRFYFSVHANQRISTHSLVLRKGDRAREAEEAVLDVVALNALAEACGVARRLVPSLLAGEQIQVDCLPAEDLLESLLRQERSAIYAQVDGQVSLQGSRPIGLLPGAFNPVHEGHWRLAELAAQVLGGPVVFELSVLNVDKPPLSSADARRRLQPFTWRSPVWITRAATFIEKASLFPGVVFVIGADTAQRIVAPRYYHDSEPRMLTALEHIRKQGCRFLVAGREDQQGRFFGIEHLVPPDPYRDLFAGIPESAFHISLSSTALRAEAAGVVASPNSEE